MANILQKGFHINEIVFKMKSAIKTNFNLNLLTIKLILVVPIRKFYRNIPELCYMVM